MLGEIISIEENTVLVKLDIDLRKASSLINVHVVFEDDDHRVVGEVLDIKDGIARVNLAGEIEDDFFSYGVIKKPSFSANVRVIKGRELELIIGKQDSNGVDTLIVGESPLYKDFLVNINVNDFFSNHFCIFGSTGSGKSCAVASIFQSLFRKEEAPENASIFVFDAYGEYHHAFRNFNNRINFKAYTTDVSGTTDTEILKIPLWILGVDDLALLLNAESGSQLPIVDKALKLVRIFRSTNADIIKTKNDIIARALLEVLYSGNTPSQIRDQIFAILTTYHTEDLSLESKIVQPGYVRTLKQCLIIDGTGKIHEMELVTKFIESFIDDSNTLLTEDIDEPITYNLEDLKEALDFALISEGIFKSDKVYDNANILKVRLESLINGEGSRYFDYGDYYITKEQYLKALLTDEQGQKVQMVNFNINYIDDRLAKVITKIYSKLIYDIAKDSNDRGTHPYHIVLEEAHRYVQNDNDTKLLGYNIFDRITKEGRKYGVIMGFISQRPSELSETALSQCSNFLIFRMLHPMDLEYMKKMIPNITDEVLNKMKILKSGTCVAFGLAFKIPILINIYLPDPLPNSSSCHVSEVWY